MSDIGTWAKAWCRSTLVMLIAGPLVRVTVTMGTGSSSSKVTTTARRKRKKTTAKRQTSNPVWNEALVFGVERSVLKNTRVELAVFSDGVLGVDEPLGETVVGCRSTGDELAHWLDVIALKTAMARWHRLQAPTSAATQWCTHVRDAQSHQQPATLPAISAAAKSLPSSKQPAP